MLHRMKEMAAYGVAASKRKMAKISGENWRRRQANHGGVISKIESALMAISVSGNRRNVAL